MIRIFVLVTVLLSLFACSDAIHGYAALKIPSGSKLNVECSDEKKGYSTSISNIPIVVVCRNEADLSNLSLLDDHVFNSDDPTGKYRSERLDVFIAIGVTPGSRCSIEFVPVNSRWRNQEWFGGFYSACNGETYDLAGRQIRPGPFSPNDFPKYLGNLVVPDYKYVDRNVLEFL